jgi:hypothetical protein
LRRARELQLEPRVLTPPAGAGLSARLAPSLGLHEERSTPRFKAAATFAADFADSQGSAPGLARDPALRARVIAAVAGAAEQTRVGLRFDEVAEALESAGPSAAAKGAANAMRQIARAEVNASAFGAPVSPASLLAPSPAGRRAAVLVDVHSLDPAVAEDVEALALAAIVANSKEVREVLDTGPLVVLGTASGSALHGFACAALARDSAKFPLVLLLQDGPGAPSLPETIGPVREELNALVFASGASLALRAESTDGRPLDGEEIRRMTPDTLRARLLGLEPEEEPEPVQTHEAGISERAKASVAALKAAEGDIEELARKRAKGPAPGRPERKADYEARDFDLK